MCFLLVLGYPSFSCLRTSELLVLELSDSDSHHYQALNSEAFGLRLNYIPSFAWLSGFHTANCGTSGLNHVSLPVINLFSSLSISLYLYRESKRDTHMHIRQPIGSTSLGNPNTADCVTKSTKALSHFTGRPSKLASTPIQQYARLCMTSQQPPTTSSLVGPVAITGVLVKMKVPVPHPTSADPQCLEQAQECAF